MHNAIAVADLARQLTTQLTRRGQICAVGQDHCVRAYLRLVREFFSTHHARDLEADNGEPERRLLSDRARQTGEPVIDRPPPGERCAVIRGERESSDAAVGAAQRFERDGQLQPVIALVLADAKLSPAMRADLKAALQERWERSLDERVQLSPCSIVPALNALLAAWRTGAGKIRSQSAPRIGH